MSKGIIVAGFGAIGKTTLDKKYSNVIDLESGMYKWENKGLEKIPYEKRKGTTTRKESDEWPNNYYRAILEARKKYDIVLTSMHWSLLEFFEKEKIEYYLAYPTLDSVDILVERCINRGNNEKFVESLKKNIFGWFPKIKNYHPKKLLTINGDEFLEDVLKRENLL